MSATSIVSGGITMDQFAPSLSNLAGGLVTNRTGLQGRYAVDLTYSPPRLPAGGNPDDAPEFLTALEDQLGLKLQREKTWIPVLIIDSIERPSEN